MNRTQSGRILVFIAIGFHASLHAMPCVRNQEAYRRFEVLEDGQVAGTEVWQLKRGSDSTLEYRSEVSITKPSASSYNIMYQVTNDGLPRQLLIQGQNGSETARAEFVFSEKGIEARVTTGSRAPQMRGLTPAAGYAVDFGSPLSCMLTIERLQLKQGESRTIDVVLIERPSLLPKLVKQTYIYRGNEMIEIQGRRHDANRYALLMGPANKRLSWDLWTDEDYLPMLLVKAQDRHVASVRWAP